MHMMDGTNRKRLALTILIVGLLVPWVVGAYVKLELDSRGIPTVDWSYFLGPEGLLITILLTLWLGLPYIYLAYKTRTSDTRTTVSILTGFCFAVASSIFLYVEIWQSVVTFFWSLVWLPIPPFLMMLLGLALSDLFSSR